MPAVTRDKPARPDDRGYLPIAIGTLVPTGALDFDPFIRPDRAGPTVLFRERSYPLRTEDLQPLDAAGVQTLYIRVAAHVAYRDYLNREVIANKSVPSTQRYQALRTANRTVFQTAFRSGNVDRMVDVAAKIGQQMTDLVCDENVVVGHLLPLMVHDYYTYTHVMNVCTLCLVLAVASGIGERAALLAIAEGALLHDIGKRHIPPAVLNHPGRLTEEHWELVRRHPTDGFRDLCLRRDLQWGQLMMVYQHHERPDGRGYPVGVVDEEIHDWARICKVADVFDALSSDRPYRKAEPIEWVLDFLDQRAGTEFDKDLVQCLRTTIPCES
jgi:HD-GYP domain-containing protein (c-di-GMP phosphodiesterase class II)